MESKEDTPSKIAVIPDDPIVASVVKRISQRSEQGMKTYGVSMARKDVSTIEWLKHAQEEALDLAVYLERIITDLEAAAKVAVGEQAFQTP